MDEQTSYGILPLRKRGEEWEVFLVHHINGNFWGFPKGHARAGESAEEAAHRELFEESGLKVVRLLSHDSLEESYTFNQGERMIKKNVHYFPAIVSGEVRICNEEIQGSGWFSFEEAKKCLTFAEGREILKKLEEMLKWNTH